VLDEIASRRRFAHGTSDPAVAAPFAALESTQQALANLVVRGPGSTPAGEHAELLDRLRTRLEADQRALAAQSIEFRRSRARRGLGYDDVASRIPGDWTLVAYARFGRYDPTRPSAGSIPTYAAFIFGPDRIPPASIMLGPATEIDQAVSIWRTEAAQGFVNRGHDPEEADRAYHRAGLELRKLVWDPVAARLAGAQRVLIVPEGDLNLVNFAALPAEPGGYLVEHGPLMHLLTAETDVVPLEAGRSRNSGLLALGNADFDATGLFAALRPPGTKSGNGTDDEVVTAQEPYRGLRGSCPDFGSHLFAPLPATLLEVERIATLWRQRADAAETVVLTGAGASETAFKRLAPGRRTLHLATHGFFLDEACATPARTTRGIGGLRPAGSVQSRQVVYNPLFLSGLALAGANHRRVAGPDEDDGILTAEEIAMLDLTGVESVVLSACDTGVGRIEPAEGVYGLRRAFFIAGAQRLVMSLWPVDDESTQQWMRAFYDARRDPTMGTADAVRHAGSTVLRHRRSIGSSTHPFFWAGMVAAGDWR
jgi:CHAT domain-containing protein